MIYNFGMALAMPASPIFLFPCRGLAASCQSFTRWGSTRSPRWWRRRWASTLGLALGMAGYLALGSSPSWRGGG